MKVDNKKTIRRIGYKAMLMSKKRNIVAIIAIALTSVLFTTLFTLSLSIVSTYETDQFKRAGGYAQGTFKEVTVQQMENIKAHKLVKEAGERLVIGYIYDGDFMDVGAEVSFMDSNCTKWSYATPTVGKEPEAFHEISMDTASLEMLGVTPKLGAKVNLAYKESGSNGYNSNVADEFILSGYWEYDPAMPVHYINVSKDYAYTLSDCLSQQGKGEFRRDLEVMMRRKTNIEKQMCKVDEDLGYDWTTRNEENSVRIGVNWGYTSAQLNNTADAGSYVAIIAFALLIAFAGYLIIYNIFRISVAGDIRFYGLLKTIGVTPRQLMRIIRFQAMCLCAVAIPIGLLLGYFVGSVLTPVMMGTTNFAKSAITISTSPLIFVFAAVFSLVTVLISCFKPGKMAGKVSPVEAVKYTETSEVKKKEQKSKTVGPFRMALANMGRSRSKTALVMVSLSLAVVLLTVLCAFVKGFDMEKYVSRFSVTDFVVGDSGYFDSRSADNYELTKPVIDMVKEQFATSLKGSGYELSHYVNEEIDYETWKRKEMHFNSEEEIEKLKDLEINENGMFDDMVILEGFDKDLWEKVEVIDGDICSLYEEGAHNIAVIVNTDDYGNVYGDENTPHVGDKVKLSYYEMFEAVDREGNPLDLEDEYSEDYRLIPHDPVDVEYTVVARIVVPHSISFRYSMMGNEYALPKEVMEKDSGFELRELFYAFDAANEEEAKRAEEYLKEISENGLNIKYESKESIRKEFEDFKNMFALVGGALCIVVGLIGALNFVNAIMTGIIARQKEFAVLQAVGMTGKQLKKMIIYEGLLYTVGSGLVSLVLSIVLMLFTGNLFESMFWFYSKVFTFMPIAIMLPLFALLGVLVPGVLYSQISKKSIVESLYCVE